MLQKLLEKSNAVISDNHFVYKSGKHGPAYINKEMFSFMGSRNLANIIRQIGKNAWANKKMNFLLRSSPIGIIGPAEGAVLFPLILAEYFEEIMSNEGLCSGYDFFPAKTSLDKNGRHYIKDKLLPYYQEKWYVIFEDIVNGGTTIHEVSEMIHNQLGGDVLAVISFVDRGGHTAESLGVPFYYPGIRVDMEQYDHFKCPLCQAGIPINTELGKGRRWVDLFGQPPYKSRTSFAEFWEK